MPVIERRPQIRRASRALRIPVEVWDWRAGEKYARPSAVEVRAEEWLNARTGRYSRHYSAREIGALGWHLAKSPREAILRAVNPTIRRGGWLTRAVEQAKALPYA